MKTELELNFSGILERMKHKYMEKDHLFHYSPCMVPAWEPLIDKIIKIIEDWNDGCSDNTKVRIFQMKEKFGQFIVYLEPYEGNGEGEVPDEIRAAVNRVAKEGIKLCRVCGKRKVETVIESRLQWRCLDHWDHGTRWKVR